jgi:DNA adenine methylase
MAMTKLVCEPLLKWAGGKRRLLPQILLVAPSKFAHYYEPFFGGGALYFSILPGEATLSDTNHNLINAYIQVRDNPDEVLNHLQRMPNSEEDYYRIRKTEPRLPSRRAARLIYLCTLSFNGIHRQNLRGQFNVPYGYKTHIDLCDEPKLSRISKNIKGRNFVVSDFESAVSGAKSGDLIYFDPPYTLAHGNNGFLKYNSKIFSWADQNRLASLAMRLREKGSTVIVSNADHPSIRELYSGFNVVVVERHSVMAASSRFRRPVTECIFY